MRVLLSPEELAAARATVTDAYYTPLPVVGGITDALTRLGAFKYPVNVLEPSCGTGRFITALPKNASVLGVEIDPTTAAIAKLLSPHAEILQGGFQNVERGVPFDVVLGNPPFGDFKVFDPSFPEGSKHSIHNYFITKSLSMLRPGGIAAFVVSRYFMDNSDRKARELAARSADLLAAFRLPSSVFDSENTNVVTDVLFFQRHDGRNMRPLDWLDTTLFGHSAVSVNAYYETHPDQMLGEAEIVNGRFGPTFDCKGTAPSREELKSAFAEKLPENIMTPPAVYVPDDADAYLDFMKSKVFEELKTGALCVAPDGNILFKTSGETSLRPSCRIFPHKPGDRKRIADYVALRDTLRKLFELEKNSKDDSLDIVVTRSRLNQLYADFKRDYGYLNVRNNRRLLNEDADWPLVEALERNFRMENGQPVADRADILDRRVLYPVVQPAPETLLDALHYSLAQTARVDVPLMARLLKKSVEDIERGLTEERLAFVNPETGSWEFRETYLSGHIRRKLEVAERAVAGNPDYEVNVEELQKAIPTPIEAADIAVKFGSVWIPEHYVRQFIQEQFASRNEYILSSINVTYIEALGKWRLDLPRFIDDTTATSILGTSACPADELLGMMLAQKTIRVMGEVGRDSDNKPIMKEDYEASAAAQQKAEEIHAKFREWLWKDAERRAELERIYNERFNSLRQPKFNLPLSQPPNISITLRPHQLNAMFRFLQSKTLLMDHVMGAGKTLTAIASVMEHKRLGLAKKPLIVVPNSLLYQWRDEFRRAYPDANILVAEKKDMTPENREQFLAKIAMNDWDAVIMTQSAFGKIDVSRETLEEIAWKEISALQEKSGMDKKTVTELEKEKKRIRQRLDAQLARMGKRDSGANFSDLGIDLLIIDESHMFKNLAFATTLKVKGLGNPQGSAKASDLLAKLHEIRKKNGRICFLTGTPLSNTLAEQYLIQRYLIPEELERARLVNFDSWASVFLKISSEWMLDAAGRFKPVNCAKEVVNLPEQNAFCQLYTHTVTQEDIIQQNRKAGNPPMIPSIRGGKPTLVLVPQGKALKKYMQGIIKRIEKLPRVEPTEDNMLKISNDARKAALDIRLVLPDIEDPGITKTDIAAEKISRIWRKTADVRGAQLVFCDLSTPKKEKIVADENGDFDMSAMLAGQSNFSVYDDLKKKLIASGIPAEEIAYIHDADTDEKRNKLFVDVNSGKIRVLIGSRAKMGAGMNVQERLVAVHHFDPPWRPSDLAQSNARILRQGNLLLAADPNFSVDIFYYAMEKSFDAFMYQTLENKQKAFDSLRNGENVGRSMEDIGDGGCGVNSLAEAKALASGNPLFLHEIRLRTERSKLEALKTEYLRSQHHADVRIWEIPGRIEMLNKTRENVLQTLTMLQPKEKSAFRLPNGTTPQKPKEELEKFFRDIFFKCRNGKKTVAGSFRGMEIVVRCKGFVEGTYWYEFGVRGANDEIFYENFTYSDASTAAAGLTMRLNNFFDGDLRLRADKLAATVKGLKEELKTLQAMSDKTFPYEKERQLAVINHTNCQIELQKMTDDPKYVSNWKPLEELPENVDANCELGNP